MAGVLLQTITTSSTHCAKPLQHVSDHRYHSSALHSSKMEILRDRLKKKESIALNSSFINVWMTVQS